VAVVLVALAFLYQQIQRHTDYQNLSNNYGHRGSLVALSVDISVFASLCYDKIVTNYNVLL